MDIAEKKIELIKWLAGLNDKNLIDQIDRFRNRVIAGQYEKKLKPMTPAQYESLLNEAEDQYRKNQTTSQEDLEKESENW